ncbi:MAG: TonB-dependent receptor, partial [Lentisphaeraceae bacterium]|nr:TonB-dependent receptor [Lentisphaeraceae bacterium]
HLQVGFAYAVNEGLDLLIDYKWFDWDSVKQLGKSAANGGFGWSDQHIYKLGLVWQLSSNLTLRAGYSYGKSPLGDEDVFANALFAAPVEHHAACGFTYELGDSMELSMAYVHGFKNGFRENNKDIPLGGGSEVSLSLDQLTIGFAWRF